jgi:hypothetical protein
MERGKINEEATKALSGKIIDQVFLLTKVDDGFEILFTDGTILTAAWSGCEGSGWINGVEVF